MLKTRYPFVTKGSIGHAFASHTRTESPRKAGFCPFARPEVSVLGEPALGHLRYLLTDVPPQSNSPRGNVRGPDRLPLDRRGLTASSAPPGAHTTEVDGTVRRRTRRTAHVAASLRSRITSARPKPPDPSVSRRPRKPKNDTSTGISRPTRERASRLFYTLHFLRQNLRWSQAQQGLLSPLNLPSPFPWLWFRRAVDRDSENLVNPFMRVTN